MSIAEPNTNNVDQVDHLFLLVGENPLPNYVAAKVLLKENGTVYLVHSTNTSGEARILENKLKPIKVKTISLDKKEGDSKYIRDTIGKYVEGLKKSSNELNLGINYTGGTKAMSVNAYRAVLDAVKDCNPQYSYLDARNLQMLIEREGKSPSAIPVDVQVNFAELFSLHNLRWKQHNPPNYTPILYNVAEEFLHAYLSDTSKGASSIAGQWQNWCRDKLEYGRKDKDNFWSENLIQANTIVSLNSAPEKIKVILDNFDVLDKKGNLDLGSFKNKGFAQYSDACAWLSGIWLEHYVLEMVKSVVSGFPAIHECAMSFHIDDPASGNDKYDRFEFDVAFMRDYQLFALSCTTSGFKPICKQKLFEAHLRARQLGGDEARVALVCFNNYPDGIERDLAVTLRDKKVVVFGSKDLQTDKFKKKLKQWIEINSPVL
ncbi:hypothetical protein DSM106972_088260 [Dulcicalothrix desertica PCC 7102]|uniref:Card1 endonuclease domain-containing protein n=1 Tax=Dulcicalothrix desertica PCC 7102 TaxID=232991 RepID=A0A3S1A8U8_9CYAN|nr:DUF1887 family CARF protein [Dulcicalothrix desertica]RUS96155.1 hypothetical protein DSM106972_088260 [Dulcicalothrix desertica PCC 7102]TWH53911.1 uncharacterized protein DUF1887 [Dulcicalothrix desertica PCC 7102]